MCVSLGAVRLTGRFLGALAGAFGVDLCVGDPAAPDDLSRFGAHGLGITATLASPGNPTRISCPERGSAPTGLVKLPFL